MPEEILFDLERRIKEKLGLIPTVQRQTPKPEPEKIQPAPQPAQPTTTSVPEQKPSQAQPTTASQTPQARTIGRPRIIEAV